MTAFNRENMNPDRREHFVYRCYDIDGDLLYVGCTMDLDRRRKDHSGLNGSAWWPLLDRVRLAGPFNYSTARQIERDAIRDDWPIWNHNAPNRMAYDALSTRMLNRWFNLEHEIQGRPDNWGPAFDLAKGHVYDLVPEPPSRNDARRITNDELEEARRIEQADIDIYNAKVRWINRKASA